MQFNSTTQVQSNPTQTNNCFSYKYISTIDCFQTPTIDRFVPIHQPTKSILSTHSTNSTNNRSLPPTNHRFLLTLVVSMKRNTSGSPLNWSISACRCEIGVWPSMRRNVYALVRTNSSTMSSIWRV